MLECPTENFLNQFLRVFSQYAIKLLLRNRPEVRYLKAYLKKFYKIHWKTPNEVSG